MKGAAGLVDKFNVENIIMEYSPGGGSTVQRVGAERDASGGGWPDSHARPVCDNNAMCALGMTPLPACLSSGVAERAAKSADLISTIQMLVDMVGAAGVGDGGRWGCGMHVRVW